MKKIFLVIFVCVVSSGCKTSEMKPNDRTYVMQIIDQIYKDDQKYAGIPPIELTQRYGSKKAWEIFKKKRDSVNIVNQNKINFIFNRFGYLGYDKIGVETSDKFYIAVQHADNNVKFQKKILKALKKEVKNKNASKSNFAFLSDRIKVNEGKEQIFGTQISYRKNGQAFPKNGIKDSVNVDRLRKHYDLIPLKDYLNEQTIDHFELNKNIFEKLKIHEPQLYQ